MTGLFLATAGLKRKNPNVKVMIGVGGWREGGKKYSEMASKAETRQWFITSVIEFITKYRFDGLDISWEYPGSETRDGTVDDK